MLATTRPKDPFLKCRQSDVRSCFGFIESSIFLTFTICRLTKNIKNQKEIHRSYKKLIVESVKFNSIPANVSIFSLCHPNRLADTFLVSKSLQVKPEVGAHDVFDGDLITFCVLTAFSLLHIPGKIHPFNTKFDLCSNLFVLKIRYLVVVVKITLKVKYHTSHAKFSLFLLIIFISEGGLRQSAWLSAK